MSSGDMQNLLYYVEYLLFIYKEKSVLVFQYIIDGSQLVYHIKYLLLFDYRGKHNVIGVELCLRHLDTIVFVMPYIPHRKFSVSSSVRFNYNEL